MNLKGKITIEQLRSYLLLHRQSGSLITDTFRLIREDSEVLKAIGSSLMPWYQYYESPIQYQIEILFRSFGLTSMLGKAAAAKDPNEVLLAWASEQVSEDAVATESARKAILGLFGMCIGLAKNIESLEVFGKFINELVSEGDSGIDRAYFDAIRIDPTVACCDGFASRLSRAVLNGDALFLAKFQQALKGKTKKHESQLNRVRVAMRFLIDAEADRLPDDQLYELFVEKLALYSPGEDGAKALRKHLRKQKPSTTQKRRK